jgi:hypothetical protein
MKKLLISIITGLSVLFIPSLAKPEIVHISALGCNAETVRNKSIAEQCADALANHGDWPLTPYISGLHTENGLVVSIHTDYGSIMLHCLNKSNSVLITLIKLKGTVSTLELKKIIKAYFEAKTVKIQTAS